MALRLYNTMGRKMEEFVPIHSGKAGFYGCGPTVYNYAHIGNLRAYVFLDILDKTLSYLNYDITHVMNITDIGHLSGDDDEGEDKMVKTAKQRNQSVLEIAQFYTDAFFNDIDRLNIRRPDIVCKATEHVQDMIDLIKRLEEKGHTYMSGGNLYYDVSTFPDYGKLACLNLDDLKAGARIDVDQNKKNPQDFVLWFTKSKFENHALVWDSPWGRGYPGWHIECSAMSMKYLGEQIDIHTGGIDHIPVHHTNEIAQSEGATGKRWVNYWLHNEFLVIAKEKGQEDQEAGKMSKSSGNFLTLQSLVDKGFHPLDYRFFLLGAHYRSQVAFSWTAMEGAKNARKALLQRVEKVLAQNEGKLPEKGAVAISAKGQEYLDKFTTALENDLATPQALSALQVAIKDAALSAEEILSLVGIMDGVLSLSLLEGASALYQEKKAAESATPAEMTPEDLEIQALVDERTVAKKAKDFARADAIRQELQERGIQIIDTPQGPQWKRV